MTNFVLTILRLISTTIRGLFRHDSTTRGASVEFWVAAATTLLLLKFAVDSIGPRFTSQRYVNPAVQLLRILNHYAVSYTLGLMPPSSSDQGTVANAFFKVWAVLIVTMQDSIRIGRPYQPKEMTLVDMLTSLWSANQLRAHTPMHLRVPLWLMWSIHASRIVYFYITSTKAADARDESMKLVSDYMEMSSTPSNGAIPATMAGYKYIVLGEEKLRQQVKLQPPRDDDDMARPEEEDDEEEEPIITVEKVWSQGNDDALLGEGRDRYKDVCLSFALYKLLRRRFFDFPIHEASNPATRQLVVDAILDKRNNYERAFHVTEVELSFLQDFFYSKHAAVFANGFPYLRLLLSLLMTAAAGYVAYAVHDMPSVSTGITSRGRLARISHGVFVTHFIITILVVRELWEIGVYVFSQWTNVLITCRYIRLKSRQGWLWRLQRWILGKVAKIMFLLIWRGRCRRHRKIPQFNLVMMSACGGGTVIVRKRKLRKVVKEALFSSLKTLLNSQDEPSSSASVAEGSRARSSPEQLAQKRNDRLRSYLKNAFAGKEHLVGRIEHILREIEGQGETHKILAWHVATSLCQINLLEKLAHSKRRRWRDDLYNLNMNMISSPSGNNGGGGDTGGGLEDVWTHYVTAVTLSNYCAYLVTQALVPDNGLIANKVFRAVRGEAVVRSMRGYGRTMRKLRRQLVLNANRPRRDGDEEEGLVDIGTLLSEELLAAFNNGSDGEELQLWDSLGRFWAGFLLYLSASTRAVKHQVHLRGSGEITTHMWALLSHAGFLGETRHGEQTLDPDDQNDQPYGMDGTKN